MAVNLQVFGTGCPKCEALKKNAEEAARKKGIEYEVEKVTDIGRITGMGIMTTPALAIDGVVRVQGKLASVEEIEALLE